MPETQYAQSGELSITYQCVGEDPLDLLFIPGFVAGNLLFGRGNHQTRSLACSTSARPVRVRNGGRPPVTGRREAAP
jgi:hypothetical protein